MCYNDIAVGKIRRNDMKNFFAEPERRIPVLGHYDVIVAGGGPAGFAAATEAGRNGAKTLIVDENACIGGVSTSGLMSHWTGSVNSRLYSEVLKRSVEAREKYGGRNEDRTSIDTEQLKSLYLKMLKEAGVEVLLHTFICDAVVRDGKTEGIIIQNKSGRFCIFADVIVDATGDGDVAFKAGAEYVSGRENDGKMQPATLMFKVTDVDENPVYLGSFESKYQTEKGELQALAKKLLPHPAGHVLLYPNPIPGVVTVNMTNCIGVDGTKAEDLTRAELECRNQIYAIEAFLREYVPGYSRCRVITSAAAVGIRETRHFIGKQTLTEEDIYSARQFSDWVVRDAYFNFDVHCIEGAGLDETGKQAAFEQTKGYTIPYGCLLPIKLKGLILAGRCISGTHMAHSDFRAMPICLAMGEAAGIAAALAVGKKCLPEEISAEEIQKKLS